MKVSPRIGACVSCVPSNRFSPEAVPVHGCLQIAAVRDVDGHGRALRELQRRSGNRSVVGEHAHRRVADSLRNGGDLEVEGVAVG